MSLDALKQNSRNLNLVCLLFICGAIWAIYGETLNFDFLSWDDDQNVVNNRWLHPVFGGSSGSSLISACIYRLFTLYGMHSHDSTTNPTPFIFMRLT